MSAVAARNARMSLSLLVGIAISVLLFGLPGLAFLVILTYGAILLPLLGLAFIAPFVLLNFLVWAWHGAFRPARRRCSTCDGTS